MTGSRSSRKQVLNLNRSCGASRSVAINVHRTDLLSVRLRWSRRSGFQCSSNCFERQNEAALEVLCLDLRHLDRLSPAMSFDHLLIARRYSLITRGVLRRVREIRRRGGGFPTTLHLSLDDCFRWKIARHIVSYLSGATPLT